MSFFGKIKYFFSKIFGRKKRGIFYVNGPDVLPPPLTQEEEAEVLGRLEEVDHAGQLHRAGRASDLIRNNG